MAEDVGTPEAAPPSPTCVRSIVEAFLRACESAGKKPATIKQYSTQLKPLVAKYELREFSTLSALEIDAWLEGQGKFPNGKLKAPDTRRITIITVQQLHQYALDKLVIEKPILGRIKKPAGKKRKRRPTDAEMELLLKHSSKPFALIVRAFLQSGARPNEFATAEIHHWDKVRRMLVLTVHKTDRTGDDRLIPVGPKLLPIFLEATAGRDSGPIFLSPRGKAWTSAGLTQSFTRARKKAGLDAGIILYGTRHKFASELCKKKGIKAVQDTLGHKSIVTSQQYVHSEDDDLLEYQDAVGKPATISQEIPPPPVA